MLSSSSTGQSPPPGLLALCGRLSEAVRRSCRLARRGCASRYVWPLKGPACVRRLETARAWSDKLSAVLRLAYDSAGMLDCRLAGSSERRVLPLCGIRRASGLVSVHAASDKRMRPGAPVRTRSWSSSPEPCLEMRYDRRAWTRATHENADAAASFGRGSGSGATASCGSAQCSRTSSKSERSVMEA